MYVSWYTWCHTQKLDFVIETRVRGNKIREGFSYSLLFSHDFEILPHPLFMKLLIRLPFSATSLLSFTLMSFRLWSFLIFHHRWHAMVLFDIDFLRSVVNVSTDVYVNYSENYKFLLRENWWTKSNKNKIKLKLWQILRWVLQRKSK